MPVTMVSAAWTSLCSLLERGVARIFTKATAEKRFDDNHRTDVWFITDRRPVVIEGNELTFDTEQANELSFGRSAVGVPNWRIMGWMRPRWWERLYRNGR